MADSLKLSGKAVKVIRYGDLFTKIFALSNGLLTTFCIKGFKPTKSIRSGDFFTAEGKFTEFNGEQEFHCSSIQFSSDLKSSISIDHRNIQLLSFRSIACQEINLYLSSKGYFPVQSPTIAGDWVIGSTRPFPIKFYGRNNFLSISNMLYHQIMMSRGMTSIYELGKLYREELSSSKSKLSEFTILDISHTFSGIQDIISIFQSVILRIYNRLSKISSLDINLIAQPHFEQITFQELIKASGTDHFNGHQLPASCRRYLDNFSSFVWVTEFPVSKRPFYSKVSDSTCLDAQLWYRGKRYLAAGTEVETDIQKIIHHIEQQGRDTFRYKFYIDALMAGYPPMSMIGLGLELLLTSLVQESYTADFSWFPRYQSTTVF